MSRESLSLTDFRKTFLASLRDMMDEDFGPAVDENTLKPTPNVTLDEDMQSFQPRRGILQRYLASVPS